VVHGVENVAVEAREEGKKKVKNRRFKNSRRAGKKKRRLKTLTSSEFLSLPSPFSENFFFSFFFS